jgi:hypothetical protein
MTSSRFNLTDLVTPLLLNLHTRQLLASFADNLQRTLDLLVRDDQRRREPNNILVRRFRLLSHVSFMFIFNAFDMGNF